MGQRSAESEMEKVVKDSERDGVPPVHGVAREPVVHGFTLHTLPGGVQNQLVWFAASNGD